MGERIHRVLIAAGALLLILGVATDASAQDRPPFAVAEVRADGLLLPVAKWEDGRWHALALAPDRVPYFAHDARWYYMALSGARSTLIEGDAVSILTDNFGYDSWGFTTILPAGSSAPGAPLTERVGIATSDSVPIRLFRAASAGESALARAVLRRLLDSVRTAHQALGPPAAPDSFQFGASAVGLSAGVTLLSAYARLPIGPLPGLPHCPILAAYDGWIIIRGDRVDVHQSPTITDCDLKEVMSLDPLGVFEVAGRTFVLSRQVGWEIRTPVIYEWGGSQLTLAFERLP